MKFVFPNLSGSPMVLKVPYSGEPPISATWSYNGNRISNSRRYNIATTNTYSQLTVSPFEKDDFGVYEVRGCSIDEFRFFYFVSYSKARVAAVIFTRSAGSFLLLTKTPITLEGKSFVSEVHDWIDSFHLQLLAWSTVPAWCRASSIHKLFTSCIVTSSFHGTF